jgi:hypothetical protein
MTLKSLHRHCIWPPKSPHPIARIFARGYYLGGHRRNFANVKFVHFNDLKNDLSGAILDINLSSELPQKITSHCIFDDTKAHAETVTPKGA